MMEDFVNSKDGYKIPIAYFPISNPKGLVQLVHGSWEHKERYYEFINYLNQNGYSCIISDLRGHGDFINEKYKLAHMENFEEIIEDLHQVSLYIKNKNPNLKLYLLGHSLGTLFARIYLEKYDSEISKLILSGCVYYRSFSCFGPLFVKALSLFKGDKYAKSKFLAKMSGLDKPSNKWISYNQENIEKTKNDTKMAKEFTLGGYDVLFKSNYEIGRIKHFHCQNPNLKILLVSGEDDLITGKTKGLKSSIKLLNKIGYKDVTNIVYPKMMHEILNENNREKVYLDIVSFLDK